MINPDHQKILKQLLQVAQRLRHAVILCSHGFQDSFGKYEIMAGFGAKKTYASPDEMESDSLKIGFISYDFKNKIEQLDSRNPEKIPVPDFYFFEPELFFTLDRDGNILSNFDLNSETEIGEYYPEKTTGIQWHGPDRNAYLETIGKIREDIRNGEYYELNYCTEWHANGAEKFNPFSAFGRLSEETPAPFSAFVRYEDTFLLCSSPERFLSRNGRQLVSQPIKGTRKRAGDPHSDSLIRTELMTSEKDRAENVMITDLVRNDLSRCCKAGTVEVDELCGIHTFSHVHQMISTVTGELNDGAGLADIIRATFPMGSMTGAPKVNVMQHIEKYENFRRGWYSGSVGYVMKDRFDLNVVIRSLQFDASKGIVAYHVGGAITYDSLAESEFEECLTKAAGLRKALGFESDE